MLAERRRWPRQIYAGGRLPPRTRLRPGDLVTLVDVSRGGALVESGLRLRWGARCDVEWAADDGVVSVAARVVRCFVARVEPSVLRYRTALRFDVLVTPPATADLLREYQVPNRFPAISRAGVASAQQARSASAARSERPAITACDREVPWHRP